MNKVSSNVVQTLVADNVQWYSSSVSALQQSHVTPPALTLTSICSTLMDQFKKVRSCLVDGVRINLPLETLLI